MSRALTRYRRSLPARRMSDTTLILVVAAIGLVIWFLLKKQGSVSQGGIGQNYRNTKSWDITYNSEGMPTRIVKHVDARIE